MRIMPHERRLLAVAVGTAVIALVATIAAVAASPLGIVQRVTVAYDGGLANNESNLGLACSSDGRYVAFASAASNIIAGDTNARYDIFWRDTRDHVTKLVSASVDGTFTPKGALNYCDMTPDGRYVVFCSDGSTFVPTDTNGTYDVFRRDMFSEETTLVSTASDGTQGNDQSDEGSISDDGRYVVFFAVASNLFPNDTNNRQDCVVKDLVSGQTTNASRTYDGGLGNGHSFYATISGNGRKVAFVSYANNLVPGDSGRVDEANLFVRDLDTGAIDRVDATPAGGESAGTVAFNHCDLDYTGKRVAFMSTQTDLVTATVGPATQIFVRDTESHETTVVSRATNGGASDGYAGYPSISGDGRYVSFVSVATNLVTGDTNGTSDVFLRDMASTSTELLSLNENGQQLDNYTGEQSLSASATAVVFNSAAHNILPPFTGSYSQIYLRVFRVSDSEAPAVTTDAHASDSGTETVSITATDGPNGSGVRFIEWKLDSAATQTVDSESAALEAGLGSHTLWFRAEDVAGNSSETTSVAFTVRAATNVTLVSVSKTLTSYGQTYLLSGILRSGSAALGFKQVRLQTSTTSSGFTGDAVMGVTAADGTFAIVLKPASATFYRVYFGGDPSFGSSPYSTYVSVTPVPSVGVPIAPAKMSRSKYYAVYGYLKPRHAAGTYPVRIYKWKKSSGSWKAYGYTAAKASNFSTYTKYSSKLRLASKGVWRVRAYAPADAGHAAAWSSTYDYVTVK
jgi:hypothetical protein